MTHKPRIITRASLAATAAARWRAQYMGYKNQYWHDVGHALEALGTAPSADDVDEVTGGGGWTRRECDCCGLHADPLVEVGEPLDYESRTAAMCETCLAAAVDAMSRAKESVR